MVFQGKTQAKKKSIELQPRETLLDEGTCESVDGAWPCEVPAKGMRAKDCAMWFPATKKDDGRVICTPCLELSVKKENQVSNPANANVTHVNDSPPNTYVTEKGAVGRPKKPNSVVESDEDDEEDEEFRPGSDGESSDSDYEYHPVNWDDAVKSKTSEATASKESNQSEAERPISSPPLPTEERPGQAASIPTPIEINDLKKCELCFYTAPTWLEVMGHLKSHSSVERGNMPGIFQKCMHDAIGEIAKEAFANEDLLEIDNENGVLTELEMDETANDNVLSPSGPLQTNDNSSAPELEQPVNARDDPEFDYDSGMIIEDGAISALAETDDGEDESLMASVDQLIRSSQSQNDTHVEPEGALLGIAVDIAEIDVEKEDTELLIDSFTIAKFLDSPDETKIEQKFGHDAGGVHDPLQDSGLSLEDKNKGENEGSRDMEREQETDSEHDQNYQPGSEGGSSDSDLEINESDDNSVRVAKQKRSRCRAPSAKQRKERAGIEKVITDSQLINTMEEIAEETNAISKKDRVQKEVKKHVKKRSKAGKNAKEKVKEAKVVTVCYSRDCSKRLCLGKCSPEAMKPLAPIPSGELTLQRQFIKNKNSQYFCDMCNFSSSSPDEVKRHTVKHVMYLSPTKKDEIWTREQAEESVDDPDDVLVQDPNGDKKLNVLGEEDGKEIHKTPTILGPPIFNCQKSNADFAMKIARRFVKGAQETGGGKVDDSRIQWLSEDSKGPISFDGLKEFICGLCKSPRFSCSTLESLTGHYESEHQAGETVCPNCEELFKMSDFLPHSVHCKKGMVEKLYLRRKEKNKKDENGLFVCTYCPWDKKATKFKAYNTLRRHRQKAHAVARYRCSLCPTKVLNVPQRILMHINLDHATVQNIPDLEAPCCKLKVPLALFEEHMLKCFSGKLSKIKTTCCEFCGLHIDPRSTKSGGTSRMTVHLRRAHAAGKNYQCPFKCPKDEPNVAHVRHPGMIVEHVQKEHADETSTRDALCPWCEDSVALPDLMKHCIGCLKDSKRFDVINSNYKGAIEQRRIICPYCNEEVNHYANHLSRHFPNLDGSHLETKAKTCHLCDKLFPTVGRMCNHLKRVHSYYTCMCKYCLFSCAMPHELANHHAIEHNDKEAYLFCSGCGERISLTEYVDHCAGCFKKSGFNPNAGWKKRLYFPIISARRNLKRKQESGLCEQCGHARSDCGHMSQAVPTPEKKPTVKKPRVLSAPCPTCGKQYLNHSSMEWHIKTAHGNFVFKCDMCEREYKNRDSLRMHKDEKHGEPRFPCSDCDLMFHSVNQRWYHYNKKHKIAK